MSTRAPSFWSKTQIASLIRLLLVLMVIAGVFFTGVFIYLKSQLNQLNQTLAHPLAHIQQLSELLDIFIIAVLFTMSLFLALMFMTLVGKISRPLLKMQRQIEAITRSNDFSQRLHSDYQDEVGAVANAFNHLLNNLDATFKQTNACLAKIVQGDYHQRVTLELGGDLAIFTRQVNQAIDSLQHTMQSLQTIAHSLAQGDFKQRMSDHIEGQLRLDVNHAMHTLDTMFQQINNVLSDLANCHFEQRLHLQSEGQLAQLAKHTNQTIDALQTGLSGIFQAIDRLSRGELNQQIQGDFSGDLQQLNQHMNSALAQLNHTINSVKRHAQQIEHNAQTLLQGNTELAQCAQHEASGMQQTHQTMMQLAQGVQHISDFVAQANQLTLHARHQTEHSREVMLNAVHSMQTIQHSSIQINDMVSLIDSIAFQTNLLALNASVEAARAGEQGRGFAVVATEVRQLAQRSAQASQDIRQLIDQVLSHINQGVINIERTQHAFEDSFKNIQQLNDTMGEISVRSKEQKHAIAEVSQRIEALDQALRHTAQTLQQHVEHNQHLKQLGLELHQQTQVFQTCDTTTQ
ncbi:MAG: methyl-accepting chemotaxis protein [Thiomicrospira sp.]